MSDELIRRAAEVIMRSDPRRTVADTDDVKVTHLAIANALYKAGLLVEPLEGGEDVSAVQEWVMIPADEVHEEWGIAGPDGEQVKCSSPQSASINATTEGWRMIHRYRTDWQDWHRPDHDPTLKED